VESVSVVIPVLNEAETIGFVVRELPRDVVSEVIVVDGGSTDGTPAAAAAAGARVIAASTPGYGRACAEGAAAADDGCTIVAFMDGDGADRGDLIGRLVEPVLAGTHHLVLASRVGAPREPGAMARHQLLAGRLAGIGIGKLYGVRLTDMCAYRAIRRDKLMELGMREMTYGWNLEMQMKAARAGLRMTEIKLPYRRRRGGSSKVAGSFSGTLRAGVRILQTFARVALAR
jgi:glycosyltransferase involved in cell wall biosynthesis